MKMTCHSCGRELEATLPVGRRDACERCGADLRCCLQCRLHDEASSNECREPQAEVPRDRERANFCEFFVPGAPAARGAEPVASAKEAFDALFRK